jgi:hypothetical protein
MRILWLGLLAFTLNSYAQNFNLQLENKYDNVYESLSGVVVVSDDSCEVEDYYPVVLHYFNNPADSGIGGAYDTFTYRIEEPVIVAPNDCATFSGCTQEVFEPYIDYVSVVKTCNVYGVAMLRDSGQQVIQTNSEAIYDKTSSRLYLYNTKIYEHLQNTGVTFEYAQFLFTEDGIKFEDYTE